MKDGHILGPVNDFLMYETVNVLHLLQETLQVLLVIITMGIDPNIVEKGGISLYIQYMIQR
jgi:hypothetical protein